MLSLPCDTVRTDIPEDLLLLCFWGRGGSSQLASCLHFFWGSVTHADCGGGEGCPCVEEILLNRYDVLSPVLSGGFHGVHIWQTV